MLNWIRKYIIGGATGTTELAMLAFFGVGAMTLFAVWKESEGVMMENTFNLLIFLWPSIGALIFGNGLTKRQSENKKFETEAKFLKEKDWSDDSDTGSFGPDRETG